MISSKGMKILNIGCVRFTRVQGEVVEVVGGPCVGVRHTVGLGFL